MNAFKTSLACGLLILSIASADPVHRVADGAYWHHDSGWIFPEKIGGFERVGAAQDVAGTADAVAYYAREIGGARIVVSVDVFPADSAAEGTTVATATAVMQRATRDAGADPDSRTLEIAAGVLAAQVTLRQPELATLATFFFVESGEWRVRIQTGAPVPEAAAAEIEKFARGQRWDTLPR